MSQLPRQEMRRTNSNHLLPDWHPPLLHKAVITTEAPALQSRAQGYRKKAVLIGHLSEASLQIGAERHLNLSVQSNRDGL